MQDHYVCPQRGNVCEDMYREGFMEHFFPVLACNTNTLGLCLFGTCLFVLRGCLRYNEIDKGQRVGRGSGPMTIQSLQKIIRLERELYAAEQAEQEKASRWLKEQEAEILRQHEKQLAALEEKISEVKTRATEDATTKASSLIREAQARAESIDGVEDSGLRRLVEKSLRYIVGQAV